MIKIFAHNENNIDVNNCAWFIVKMSSDIAIGRNGRWAHDRAEGSSHRAHTSWTTTISIWTVIFDCNWVSWVCITRSVRAQRADSISGAVIACYELCCLTRSFFFCCADRGTTHCEWILPRHNCEEMAEKLAGDRASPSGFDTVIIFYFLTTNGNVFFDAIQWRSVY